MVHYDAMMRIDKGLLYTNCKLQYCTLTVKTAVNVCFALKVNCDTPLR